MVTAGPNGFSIFLLFICQFRIQQESRHADDTVHGGPDFVTHGRQESRLGFSGGLGLPQCGIQLLIDML